VIFKPTAAPFVENSGTFSGRVGLQFKFLVDRCFVETPIAFGWSCVPRCLSRVMDDPRGGPRGVVLPGEPLRN